MNGRVLLHAALQLVLAVGYVRALTELMNLYALTFGNALTGLAKVAMAGLPAAVSLLVLFLLNHFLFKTNAKALGAITGVVTFSYFYIIHPESPVVIVSVVLYWPTLVNMLLMVGGPIVAGVVLNKRFQPTGPLPRAGG